MEPKFTFGAFKTISRAISTYEDLNLLINHFAEGLVRTFKIKGCCIMLYDEREKQLFQVASCGISMEYLTKGPVFLDDRFYDFKKGEPVIIEDLEHDPRVQYPEAAKKENINALLSVPIKYKDAILGIVRLYHHEAFNIHAEDLDSIKVISRQLGLVIENNGYLNFIEKLKAAMESLPLRMLTGLHP